MTEQVQEQQMQEPIEITLTLNLKQVQSVLNGLGELKTSAGVWPLQQYIFQQAQKQIPQKEAEENTEVSENETSTIQ